MGSDTASWCSLYPMAVAYSVATLSSLLWLIAIDEQAQKCCHRHQLKNSAVLQNTEKCVWQ